MIYIRYLINFKLIKLISNKKSVKHKHGHTTIVGVIMFTNLAASAPTKIINCIKNYFTHFQGGPNSKLPATSEIVLPS